MIQLFVGMDENKGKSYIVIPMSECDSMQNAIALANRVYFKAKLDSLEGATGYVYKNILKVGSWIGKENLNVWVVARK